MRMCAFKSKEEIVFGSIWRATFLVFKWSNLRFWKYSQWKCKRSISIRGENEHYYQIQALSSFLLSAHSKQHAWKRCCSRLDECLGWADLICLKSQCPKKWARARVVSQLSVILYAIYSHCVKFYTLCARTPGIVKGNNPLSLVWFKWGSQSWGIRADVSLSIIGREKRSRVLS